MLLRNLIKGKNTWCWKLNLFKKDTFHIILRSFLAIFSFLKYQYFIIGFSLLSAILKARVGHKGLLVRQKPEGG